MGSYHRMNKTIFTLIKALFFTVLFLAFIPAQSQGVDEQYKQAIESADSYFDKADYLNAKASYQVASQLKPDEQYPKDRMKESISLLKVQMQKMAEFNDKLAYADRLYQERSWENSILAYEEAGRIMPSDPYPADQIKLIREIQSDEAENEGKYTGLINEGDALFAAGDYAAAMTKYDDAAGIYPGRQEVNDKIDATNQRLSEIAAQQSGYEKAISEAEMYHARKDYENELLSYQAASELKPEEPLPQIKIRELNDFLRKYEAYNKFVAEGDDLYISQQFAEARIKYEQALEILPEENYPKEIISKINIALSEKTERDKAAYEEAIAKADELYNQEDYQSAMIAYSDALRFWPDGEHAQRRLGRISEIMALKKAQEEAYANSITLADKLFANQEYAEAKAEYRKAADINPFEQYPKVRIDEIDVILAQYQNQLDQYEAIIQGADKLFNAGDYAQSRIQYLKAQDIMSDRSYPEDQIKMIDEILGRELATREAYEAAIARGDEHFTKREWEDAKVDYSAANDLIQAEQYPKDKITEINNILAQLQAEQETYTLALKAADQLLLEKDYNAALMEYRKAAEIFTDEEYPQQKIEEINGILAEQTRLAGIDESYANALAEGDRNMEKQQYNEAKASYELALTFKADETYPKEKIAEIASILAELARLQGIDDSYSDAIASADLAMGQQEYNTARSAYEVALGLKPAEQYPQDKINEIDAIFADEAARIAKLGADYTQAIADGDALLIAKDYDGAKVKYMAALALMPDETYPAQKVSEIDGILAELERLRLLDIEYADLIADADGMFSEEAYTNARAEYEKASVLKPEEIYPKDKISEIDAIFAEQARLLGIEESYATAITAADAFMLAEQFDEAKAEYQKALTLKADEAYPQQKISEIDAIFASLAEQQEQYLIAIGTADNYFNTNEYEQARESYVRAQGIKADEPYPAQRIAEIDGILANLQQQLAIDEAYANAIAHGDNFFNNKEYTEAKAKYEEALGLKAEQQYPQDKIAEIDGIFASIQEIEDNYNTAIANADAAFTAGDFLAAREAFQTALGIKAGEQYPADRLTEISGLLDEQSRLAAIDAQYAKAISGADSLFALKEYEDASRMYSQALGIKATESYPQEKIDEIITIQAEIARQQEIDDNYNQAITDADDFFNRGSFIEALQEYNKAAGIKPDEAYPKGRITEINSRMDELEEERLKAYNTAIAQADNYYNMANYRLAKSSYQTAVDIKSDEQYARDRLDEVTVIYMAELESLKVDYRKYIADADNYFNSKIYDGAIENYRLAAGILPDETYPGQMIARITKIINDNAITDVNKLAQVIPNNTDRKFSFTALPVNVRKENYILIKARNVSDHDFKMLVNFGRDNSKNGGVVLQVPQAEASKDYIIRIGALYKWFSEDNNWLSIYPEGGDIEIALIRISKSD